MADNSVRLGIDIGGTFTDVVLEAGDLHRSVKLLTTHKAPEDAIMEGIKKVCDLAGISVNAISQIVHGTTLATNALIERRGAKTALITTQGFRDVIEMRTESRFEQYDLNLVLPEPLLPRNRRYTLTERVAADGHVLIKLNRQDIEILSDELAEADYQSIAIGFLHSYVNDHHEKMVAEILKKRLPGVMISLSSEVSPQMREYERFNTTIANAYIKPMMKVYLSQLKGRLIEEGVNGQVFLMHSAGGIISLENAAEFPVRLIESGPAGGAVFASDIVARHGLDKVLSFDMGGTTAKICLIKNKTPKTARTLEVARSYRFKKGSGMPISIPVIDMVEIGAGGGSIARVDSMEQIRVGPESAGSDPGPACYDRGGDKPAVTDADLILGKLDPENFAGGSIVLAPKKAQAALRACIGEALAMDDIASAWGLAEVVDENMANAARMHAVENGEDLSEYTMIAFGGAAPLHAGRLCEKLGIGRCLVPQGASVGSAIGFLRAPASFEANRSVFMTIDDFDTSRAADLFAEMEDEAVRFVRSCDSKAPIHAEFKVYMRYSGQGWEIPVPLSRDEISPPTPEILLKRFEDEYQTLFGRSVEGIDVEITVWSVNATTPTLDPPKICYVASQSAPAPAATRQVFEPARGQSIEAGIYARAELAPGSVVQGPAVITEDQTTIILPASRQAKILADGCIDISNEHGD